MKTLSSGPGTRLGLQFTELPQLPPLVLIQTTTFGLTRSRVSRVNGCESVCGVPGNGSVVSIVKLGESVCGGAGAGSVVSSVKLGESVCGSSAQAMNT